MTIPTISTLPTAPARTDPPATFVTRADSFLAALVVMQGELNTSIGAMNTDISGIAANVTAAQAAQTAAETAETNAETAESNASTSETNAQIYAAAAQAAAGIPSLVGNAEKKLAVNATEDGVEWVEVLSDPTLGTLTKTFTAGESSTINLTSSVLAPVVSVTKEVPQTAVTNNNWDVNSNTENYTRLNSAYATTLDFVGDLSSASFVDSFSVAGQETSPRGLAFNTDGTKMFILGIAGLDVNEYTLSTGFDVSTASFVDSFSVSGQDTSPWGLAFNSDGTKMYVTGITGVDINEYTLSTGFDVSTASYSQNYSLSAQTATPRGVSFNLNGTKMFIADYSSSAIDEYALSTAFDISSASYTQAFSVSSQETQPLDVAFNATGTTMFVVGNASDNVNSYSLSTPFDVSTSSFVESLDVSSQDTNPSSLAFNAQGTKMFVVGYASDNVNEYSLPLTLALGTGSFASADVGKTIEANDGAFVLTAADGSYVETTAPTSYAQVASGSWGMYGVVYNAADGDLQLSGYAEGYKFNLASYSSLSFSVAAQDSQPEGITFNSDGTKLYMIGKTTDVIYQYSLSSPFDISTASYSAVSFSVAGQETTPSGIIFNPLGTKMYIIGETTRDIFQYSLSVAFDLSTATYDSVSFATDAQGGGPQDIKFNNDGTKIYVVESDNERVNQYSLSTAYNIGTATYDSVTLNISAQDTFAKGLDFNADGTKMYIVGQATDAVYEYIFTTAFDLSTASYNLVSFSVSGQDATPSGIKFSSDGTKMYIVGGANDSVYQYSTSELFTPTGYQPVHTTASTDTTYWTDINSMTADQNAGDGNVYYAISTDDRTTWTVIDNTDGERDIVRNNAGTWQYNSNATYALETWVNGTTNTELATLAEAMDGVSTSTNYSLDGASYSSLNFNFTQDANPRGIAFNSSGTKMYIVGSTGDSVYQFSLSTAWNVSTSSYDSVSFSVASQEIAPWTIVFNNDGTKMYILGTASKQIFQYSLSTAFNLSTASYDSVSFNPTSQAVNPLYFSFNADGTIMYVGDYIANVIYQYALGTAFNVSTAVYSSISFSPSSEMLQSFALNFNPTGTKAFIMGETDTAFQYSLSTAWDISTATYDSFNLNASSEDSQQYSMVFGDNGSKLYTVGNATKYVYQYSTVSTDYPNQMDKTQLDAVTDPNHIALGNDLDLAIVFNMTSGTTVPSSDGVAINYDANVLNKGAVLGTDYDFDAPAGDKARITALTAGNFKVRVV